VRIVSVRAKRFSRSAGDRGSGRADDLKVGEGRRGSDDQDHAMRLGGPRDWKARNGADHGTSLRRLGVNSRRATGGSGAPSATIPKRLPSWWLRTGFWRCVSDATMRAGSRARA
jgi:hypothetical protein